MKKQVQTHKLSVKLQIVSAKNNLLIVRKQKLKCVPEERKKDQEHKVLSWFTLPQGLRPVLCKLEKISTKRSPRSVLQDTILLPAETTYY